MEDDEVEEMLLEEQGEKLEIGAPPAGAGLLKWFEAIWGWDG